MFYFNFFVRIFTFVLIVEMQGFIQMSHFLEAVVSKNSKLANENVQNNQLAPSLRFLCRPTTLYIIARAVERQSTIYTENSGFASPTLGQHISTFRGYQIFIFYQKPLYKLLHQSFFYSFITILPSESGVTLHYSTILPQIL